MRSTSTRIKEEDIVEEVNRVFTPEDVEAGPSGIGKARKTWRSRSRGIPPELRRLFNTVDVPVYRVECLEDVERSLYGWRDRRAVDHRRPGVEVTLTPVQVRGAYRRALEGSQRERTLRLVRHGIDRAKKVAFVRKLTDESRATEPPDVPTRSAGYLQVFDPKDRREPTYGVRSAPEATPVQVPAYAIDTLKTYAGRDVETALDVTGGGGTNRDVVASHGGSTVELDLAPVADRCLAIDVRSFKRSLGTSRRFDLIFFHPPSIGVPSAIELLDGASPSRDLCWGDLDAWVEVVSTAMVDALELLAPGHGLLSVVVPEGVRDHQRVLPLPGIAHRLETALPEDAFVVDRLQLKWGYRARQVSLGRNRVPSVHLLIAREGSWP